jgi:uncharacterized RDD family membrane protein YckC
MPPSPGYASAPGYAPGYAPGPAYGASAHAPGYAPGMAWEPPAEVTGAVGGLEYAGALPRLVAWIIDGLILGILGLILFAIAAVIFAGSIDWTQYTSPGYTRAGVVTSGAGFGAFLVAAVIGLVIDVAYFVFLWTGSARATLGMRLLHLQVAKAADGSTLSRSQGFVRWIALGQWLSLLSYVPFVGLLSSLIAFVWDLVILLSTATSSTKQGVHDRFVGSVVVQPRGGQSNGLIIGCLLIIAILLILPIVAIVALIFLGSQVSNILVDVGNSV